MERACPIDLTADGHVHTRFCNHARGSMEEYVRAAVARGLRSLTFLEHLEVGIDYAPRTWLRKKDFIDYFRIGSALRDRYRDRIRIRIGLEAGININRLAELKRELDRLEPEEIGLSCHYITIDRKTVNVVSRRRRNLTHLADHDPDLLVSQCLREMIQAIGQVPCDRVCHLDAMLRHLITHPLSEHQDPLLRELLSLMRAQSIALEINTSGFAIRGEPFPTRRIALLALDMGVQLVAGSDAHHPDQVGRYFARIPDWLTGLHPQTE